MAVTLLKKPNVWGLFYRPRTLGGRLVIATLFFSFVFTVLAVVGRTWSAWQTNLVVMNSELLLIEQVYHETLAKAIWDMDRESLRAHLNSVANVREVGRIVVKISPAGQETEVFSHTQPGWMPSNFVPTRHLNLTNVAYAGAPPENVGELELNGDDRVLWSHLREEIAAIVITQVIQSLLLAGFIMLMFNRSVTVHVQRIAKHLSLLKPDNLANNLVLKRDDLSQDELTMLVNGVNLLQQNLKVYLEEKQLYERELTKHRDHLRDLVSEQTRDISEANLALGNANNALLNSADTLRKLGDIGKNLTTNLDRKEICVSLYQHLIPLIPLDSFGIAILGNDGNRLEFIYYVEDGVIAEPISYLLSDPKSFTVRAFLEEQELIVANEEQTALMLIPSGITRTIPIKSAVFRPLTIIGKRIGVMVAFSHSANAYLERELEILRLVAPYVAIALSNANAYKAMEIARQEAADAFEQLRQTQSKLVQQEKLAALGQLVAGIAHEINTPVGVTISGASQLSSAIKKIKESFSSGKLRQSEFDEFVSTAEDLSKLILFNSQRAGQLIGSFKQIAVDQTNEVLRILNLKDYTEEVLRTLTPLLRNSEVNIRLEGDSDVNITTYPGPIAQILTNLTQNALIHAFENINDPEISIQITFFGPKKALLIFSDNGNGMDENVLTRAFEPFFSTRRGQGGTGLGLHIVHNLVVGPLQGEISIKSNIGSGTSFHIIFNDIKLS
ncbi:GAF domain-containing sensor histidine kinase [Undibacterium sp. Ji67W]|uniref:GAF domain-containing sensor histidine kinase n=1 Tax=Undibacterium sp. Ji67W TaxID=3413042 RepID=UPI003BF06FCE